MSDYYVILTGSKNNAGDFLIKYRAKQLFSAIRPDRKIVDINRWEVLSAENLKIVNNSKALILMGGPALRYDMYPGIYPLVSNLDDIKAPIAMMGIGWKSPNGDWRDTYHYPLSASTLHLIERAGRSGCPISVRDFHTLNVLMSKGIDNTLMTGCPACYDLKSIGVTVSLPTQIRRVAFSLGVSFLNSKAMESAMKSQILNFRDHFSGAKLDVVFHHKLYRNGVSSGVKGSDQHSSRHAGFAEWLDGEGISVVDISGSASSLIEYYSDIDLHIGYRVHAHIFMNSIGKLSALIAEDGRGKAMERVFGGISMSGFDSYNNRPNRKILGRLFPINDRYVANSEVAADIINQINYELFSGGHRAGLTRKMIDRNFGVMKNYLMSLP